MKPAKINIPLLITVNEAIPGMENRNVVDILDVTLRKVGIDAELFA